MPMSLQEEIRLLSMVDILGPLSEEQMEDLAKRALTPSSKTISSTPPRRAQRGFHPQAGQVQLSRGRPKREEITLSMVEDGNIFGRWPSRGRAFRPSTSGPSPPRQWSP